MPKIVSPEERESVKQAIYEKTLLLIKKKGIKTITVEDIVKAVGIGKGSFYSYYASREVCLYEVINRWNRAAASRLEELLLSGYSRKETTVRFFTELLLSPDSIFTSANQFDMEMLLRKLPPDYKVSAGNQYKVHYKKAFQLMGVSEARTEVFAILTDCMNFIASNTNYSQDGITEALHVLVNTLSDYTTTPDCKVYTDETLIG